MKSIANPAELANLIERMRALGPDTPRKWGTLTPGEMLCHLADATDSVAQRSAGEDGKARKGNPFMKFIALRTPLTWPKGLATPAKVDPQATGTKPGDFEVDRQRAIGGLQQVASAHADTLAASHGLFGKMKLADWHRWAYRHTDHHLRQFGL